MAETIIPDDLRDFVLRHIDSVAQLEALLLLRSNAGRSWDVPQMAKRLYIDEQAASEALTRLSADGLVSHKGGQFRYEGQAEELRRMVDRLADAYARHLIPVTNLIHGKPRRIREFADAFKFRRDR
ncbi:MAG: hypothetical protein L6R19_08800 [Alphaproteobacteria bacterium]|nr:hypothetical protein [Alphaproteobacteria bacterium]